MVKNQIQEKVFTEFQRLDYDDLNAVNSYSKSIAQSAFWGLAGINLFEETPTPSVSIENYINEFNQPLNVIFEGGFADFVTLGDERKVYVSGLSALIYRIYGPEATRLDWFKLTSVDFTGTAQFTFVANNTGLHRYDYIEVQVREELTGTSTVKKIFDPVTQTFSDQTEVDKKINTLAFRLRTGTGGANVEDGLDRDWVCLCVIYVPPNVNTGFSECVAFDVRNLFENVTDVKNVITEPVVEGECISSGVRATTSMVSLSYMKCGGRLFEPYSALISGTPTNNYYNFYLGAPAGFRRVKKYDKGFTYLEDRDQYLGIVSVQPHGSSVVYPPYWRTGLAVTPRIFLCMNRYNNGWHALGVTNENGWVTPEVPYNSEGTGFFETSTANLSAVVGSYQTMHPGKAYNVNAVFYNRQNPASVPDDYFTINLSNFMLQTYDRFEADLFYYTQATFLDGAEFSLGSNNTPLSWKFMVVDAHNGTERYGRLNVDYAQTQKALALYGTIQAEQKPNGLYAMFLDMLFAGYNLNINSTNLNSQWDEIKLTNGEVASGNRVPIPTGLSLLMRRVYVGNPIGAN